MGLLRGNKFNSRHSTVVPGAKEFLKALKKNDGVKKIALGEISPTKVNAPRRVKVRSRNGNFMVILFRDVSATQVFNITAVEGFADSVVASIKSFIP